MEKFIIKHHKYHMQQLMQAEGPSKSYMAGLLTWHSIVGCFNHDVHNALKWCASQCTKNAATMKGAFISTSAARNGRHALIKHVSEWVLSLTVFEDWDGMGDEDIKRYYEIFGIEPGIIDLFFNTQIRYSGGRMIIASHLQHSTSATERTSTC